MEILKPAAICLITAVTALFLREKRGEYAFAVTLAGGTAAAYYIIAEAAAPIAYLKNLINNSGIKTEYLGVALKSLCIGYITAFIADACRDCGQSGLAAKAELAGKCAVFLLVLPVIASVLETALGFLE